MENPQRRRWNDNINEATGDTVVEQTAAFTGIDTAMRQGLKKIEQWQKTSPFAREQSGLPEGPAWSQQYPTEAEMARAALELALLCVDDDIFDWGDYPVTELIDSGANELTYPGGIVPA